MQVKSFLPLTSALTPKFDKAFNKISLFHSFDIKGRSPFFIGLIRVNILLLRSSYTAPPPLSRRAKAILFSYIF